MATIRRRRKSDETSEPQTENQNTLDFGSDEVTAAGSEEKTAEVEVKAEPVPLESAPLTEPEVTESGESETPVAETSESIEGW